MLYDNNMSINNVLRMVVFLVGQFDKAHVQEQLISTVKHEVKMGRHGKPSVYNFDKQDLWENFFMKDETMQQRLFNHRIDSMEELEMKTWEYVESHKGSIAGNLF